MTYAPARPSDRPPAHHASEFSNVRPFPANESEGERANEGTQERERLGMRCQSRLRSLPQNSLETRTFYYARQRGRRAHARQSGQSERARARATADHRPPARGLLLSWHPIPSTPLSGVVRPSSASGSSRHAIVQLFWQSRTRRRDTLTDCGRWLVPHLEASRSIPHEADGPDRYE